MPKHFSNNLDYLYLDGLVLYTFLPFIDNFLSRRFLNNALCSFIPKGSYFLFKAVPRGTINAFLLDIHNSFLPHLYFS